MSRLNVMQTGVYRWALVIATLPTAAWALWEGGRLASADWASASARNWVAAHASSGTQPVEEQEWESSRRAIQSSLQAMPDDPDLHERLGDLYTVAGRRDFNLPAARRQDYRLAADAYRQATRLRPTEAPTWAMLAASTQLAGGSAKEVQLAWATALRLGPFEEHVRPTLLQVVLSDWPGATPAMRGWAKDLFDHGSASMRVEINTLAKPYGLEFMPDEATDRP